MKKNKIIFWVSTGLLSLMMLFSAFQYLTSPQIAVAFTHLGFPNFFRIELAWAKIIGAFVLMIPQIPARIKEWAYAAFGIVFISAFIAHLTNGDASSMAMAPLIFLAILCISYFYFHKQAKANVKVAL